MRVVKGLVIAALCAAPMIASATGFHRVDTEFSRPLVTTNSVDAPEPGTLALLLAGLGGIAVARRRRRDP